MSEDTDMLCPWCGGDLSGKPGQYVKCRHCGSDIHWGDDGKPYKTRFQAAQPNPVVRDVPVKLKPTPRVPVEIGNESGPESSFVMDDVSEIIGELHTYEKVDTQRKEILASHHGDDITWKEWWTACPLWQKFSLIFLPTCLFVLFPVSMVSIEVMKAYETVPYAPQPARWLEDKNRLPPSSRISTGTRKLPSIDPFGFPKITDEITSLTAEQAAELIMVVTNERGDSFLSLSGLTSIDKDVARELAKFEGDLSLHGLTSIDKDVAQELAKLKG